MAKQESTAWPYVLPIMSFLVLIELGGRISDRDTFWLLGTRVAVPLAVMVYFWRKGHYREVKPKFGVMTIADVLLGIVLAVLWVGPFLWFPWMRPPASHADFDPLMAGPDGVPWVLALRMLGYAVVTPLMEELFVRSFLLRYAEAHWDDGDFRDVAMAKFSWRSFAVVILVFLATHLMWEWPVMLVWSVITMLWFYLRKDLFALIVVHGVTNAAILLAAMLIDQPISLWFLV